MKLFYIHKLNWFSGNLMLCYLRLQKLHDFSLRKLIPIGYTKLFFILVISCSFNLKAQILPLAQLDSLPILNLETAIQQKNPLLVYKISLKKLKLKAIPKELFKFKNLQYLDISKNKFREFPKQLIKFPLLQELNISNNNLDSLTSQLGNLIYLQRLIAHKNNIKSISPEIKNLKKLIYLDLWDNNIGMFPKEIGQLKLNLKKLDLRVIMMNEKEQEVIIKLLPITNIQFSKSCNCGF